MPPDLNGKVSAYKALPRERDLETRRAKGEASCAECRRLKLKCDRKVPCTSCIRRGCQTICPNGSLASGQGSRFVLANTDRLHEKLLRMSARIRQLEDALQIAQASITPVSHPLLSEELLAVKSCVDIMAEREDSEDVTDRAPTSSTSGLGTLSISDYGETCFMGRGSSEAFLLVSDASADLPSAFMDLQQVLDDSNSGQPGQEGLLGEKLQEPNNVPQQILSVSRVFPFAPADLPKGEILRTIEVCLPSYARATALVEAYLSNIAWSLVIVDREQIFEELLPSVYKRPRTSSTSENGDSEYDKDYINRLALLLAVFGNGAAGDLTLPIGNEEAELFTHLARAALSINSVFTGASMEHVQTIILLAAYGFFACVKSSLEPSWKMLSFGLSLASSIGLHRDPARWNLEPRTVQRRRRVFWELFTSDKWTSVESGRPATFNLHEVDVGFPEDKYATIDEDGNIVPSYWHWKFRFMKEVMAPIAELLCLARPIKYAEVIELDRRCREFQMPSSLLMPKSPEPDEELTTSLRRFHWALIQEVSLLSLHRGFFARALLENPVRPLGSPFASSLLSAYASAVTLLKILRVYFERYPDLLMRQWMVWAHALSSTIIVGSVACRGPASFVAAPALKELEAAIDIFKNAQMHPVSKRALPFLERFLEKARSAHRLVPKDKGNARQELSILGGIPIFVNRMSRKSSESSDERSPSRGHTPATPVMRERSAHSASPVRTLAIEVSSPIQHSGAFAAPYPSQQTFSWPFVSQQQSQPTPSNSLLQGNFDNEWLSTIAPNTTVPSFTGPSSTFDSPFTNQAHADMHALTSTSWLEELSHDMSARFGQGLENNANANLDFIMGGTVGSPASGIPVSVQGEDPELAEAWRSVMADSQIFGL